MGSRDRSIANEFTRPLADAGQDFRVDNHLNVTHRWFG
jgi:hypothetical protein